MENFERICRTLAWNPGCVRVDGDGTALFV